MRRRIWAGARRTHARVTARHAQASALVPGRRTALASGTAAAVVAGLVATAAVTGRTPDAAARPVAVPAAGTASSSAASAGRAPAYPHGADGGAGLLAVPADALDGIAGNWMSTGTSGTSSGTSAVVSALRPDSSPISGLAADGIPQVAYDAYVDAANRERRLDPGCGLVWPLLAGIGRVESDHGRFAGAVLHTDGISTPRIIGIPLNGHGTALIRDTDGGRLDGDTVYDRAVGPMQFIPSTWAGWGVDADGDGRADPFDINDAAAAAAAYLCAGGRDLTTTAGQVAAVRSYNDSDPYIALVLGLEHYYAAQAGLRVPILPPGPDPSTSQSSSSAGTAPRSSSSPRSPSSSPAGSSSHPSGPHSSPTHPRHTPSTPPRSPSTHPSTPRSTPRSTPPSTPRTTPTSPGGSHTHTRSPSQSPTGPSSSGSGSPTCPTSPGTSSGSSSGSSTSPSGPGSGGTSGTSGSTSPDPCAPSSSTGTSPASVRSTVSAVLESVSAGLSGVVDAAGR